MRPSHPCSASFVHSAGVMPSGVSMRPRTTVDGHSLADDIFLDFGGTALDGVGAGAQKRVLPEAVGHRPRAALDELRVGPLDLHGQLLEPLVPLDPDRKSTRL